MFPEVVLNVFQRSFRSRKRASSINSSKSHGSEDASAAPSRLPTPELPADASALQKGACIVPTENDAVQTKADGFLENLTRFAEHVDENDAPEDGDQVLVDSDSWDHSGHKLDPILESSLSDVKMQEAADLQGQERSVLGPSTPSMRATSPYPPEQKSATHNQFLAYSPVIQSHPNSSSDSSLFVHLASPPTQFCTTPEMAIIEEIAGTTKPQDGQHVAARWTTMEAAATEKASASATKLSFTSFGSSCPDSHNEMESSPLHTSHSLEDEVSMTQEADVPLQSVSGPPSPETGELIMPYLVTPCKANVLEIASPLLEDEFSLRVAENVIEPLGVPLPTTYAEATNLAFQFPNLSEQILRLPVPSASRTPSPVRTSTASPLPELPEIPGEQPEKPAPTEGKSRRPVHTAERPNWALAPDPPKKERPARGWGHGGGGGPTRSTGEREEPTNTEIAWGASPTWEVPTIPSPVNASWTGATPDVEIRPEQTRFNISGGASTLEMRGASSWNNSKDAGATFLEPLSVELSASAAAPGEPEAPLVSDTWDVPDATWGVPQDNWSNPQSARDTPGSQDNWSNPQSAQDTDQDAWGTGGGDDGWSLPNATPWDVPKSTQSFSEQGSGRGRASTRAPAVQQPAPRAPRVNRQHLSRIAKMVENTSHDSGKKASTPTNSDAWIMDEQGILRRNSPAVDGSRPVQHVSGAAAGVPRAAATTLAWPRAIGYGKPDAAAEQARRQEEALFHERHAGSGSPTRLTFQDLSGEVASRREDNVGRLSVLPQTLDAAPLPRTSYGNKDFVLPLPTEAEAAQQRKRASRLRHELQPELGQQDEEDGCKIYD